MMSGSDSRLLQAVDLVGAFALAIQGAAVAAANGLDAFGVLVVSIATATGGGLLRDILVGERPPEALRGWLLITVSVSGGLLSFVFSELVERIPETLLLGIDALGLSLLAVAGAEKALEYKLSKVAAVMVAVVSGVGGFTIRDILLARVPAVLRVDVLATAALTGAVVLVLARACRAPPAWAALLGGATCFILRLVAVWRHWNLPTAHLH